MEEKKFLDIEALMALITNINNKFSPISDVDDLSNLVGEINKKLYVQTEEPVDPQEGSVWIDPS